jgi:hypothetical protein
MQTFLLSFPPFGDVTLLHGKVKFLPDCFEGLSLRIYLNLIISGLYIETSTHHTKQK